ncbi:sarcosine oxidase subunit gamma [Streptomyces sp. Ru73]|uniref:sarcosine oxidase subunit gamma n=1 Tax=Streptomyces sp. Ru73 TaxID=2080748 RepID=UPI000CDDBF71|nr:sarcosine oxidase subunit gamma family protein [Streptomyces sp. Ru73]POX37787.1 sarcosine oxidase subunit gamma [Streptomyces sp. Ru73]
MAEPTLTDTAAGPAALRRSPLAHLADRLRDATVTGPRAVAVTEWPCATMLSLRVAPDSAAAARIEKCLGAALPARCGQTAPAGPRTTLWLGPDEWLVIAPPGAAPLTAELTEALAGEPGSVVDVSANRTVLELCGPAARGVLDKGCPLDLHPRAFPVGHAVATQLGPVPVLLWRTAEETYRLLPRSSFADHLARWLMDAMAEYAGPVVP